MARCSNCGERGGIATLFKGGRLCDKCRGRRARNQELERDRAHLRQVADDVTIYHSHTSAVIESDARCDPSPSSYDSGSSSSYDSGSSSSSDSGGGGGGGCD